MVTNIEIEYKMLLTEEDFFRILKSLKDKIIPIKQTNIYFDTKDGYYKNRNCALRVRIKEGKGYELTLKQKRSDDNLENNFCLNRDDYRLILDKPSEGLRKFIEDVPENIISYGSLTTIRYEWEVEEGRFFLDHSIYNTLEDYEIEFEGNEYHSEHVLKNYLDRFDIEFVPNKVTKIQRYMDSLRKKDE